MGRNGIVFKKDNVSVDPFVVAKAYLGQTH